MENQQSPQHSLPEDNYSTSSESLIRNLIEVEMDLLPGVTSVAFIDYETGEQRIGQVQFHLVKCYQRDLESAVEVIKLNRSKLKRYWIKCQNI